MSALVGYGSSEGEDEIEEQRPAKIANASPAPSQPTSDTREEIVESNSQAPGPQIQPTTAFQSPTSPPLSPYSTERSRIQELTMPRVANMSIPSSPPPPSSTGDPDAAAALAATTKKFERFLALKAQGVHFNDRLRKSAALRNPGLLPTLMEFAGVSKEESYASALPEDLAVPTKWREECYVENLIKANERREKKRLTERERVDFVKAESKSARSSAASTPKGSVGKGKVANEGRRSRFDVDR